MNSHSSRLLAISLVAVLGAALFLTSGGSGHGHGILSGGVSVANAASADSSKSANVAGDKAWEVIGGPVKIGAVKAASQAKATTTTASAPLNRLPW